MFQSIWKFISYWYFRYLLVTELYMVEKWERVFIHCFFVVVFSALSYFNTTVVLNSTQYLTKSLFGENIYPANIIMNEAQHSHILGEL